jgi:hypothetical protein
VLTRQVGPLGNRWTVKTAAIGNANPVHASEKNKQNVTLIVNMYWLFFPFFYGVTEKPKEESSMHKQKRFAKETVPHGAKHRARERPEDGTPSSRQKRPVVVASLLLLMVEDETVVLSLNRNHYYCCC